MGVNEHERLTSIALGQKIRNIVFVAVLQFTVTVASSTISISLKTDSCCTPDTTSILLHVDFHVGKRNLCHLFMLMKYLNLFGFV